MLNEALNEVTIEGILSENNLEEADYEKGGRSIHCIRGELVIQTEITYKVGADKEETSQVFIPVKTFANQYKADGSPSKLFDMLKKVMNNYQSIAAVGEENADRVRLTGGKIHMNEYVSQSTGEIASFPQIQGNFFTKVKKEEYRPKAEFKIIFVVGGADYEVDRDGNETGAYKITGILPIYNGKVNVVPFKAVAANVIDTVSTYWQPGDTVRAIGKLNFTSKTFTTTVESDFGEDLESSYTRRISDLVIIGGAQNPLDDEWTYDQAEISEALKVRKAELDQKKEYAKNKTSIKETPAKKADGSFDLGF